MATGDKKASEYPFQVWVKDGVIAKGFSDEKAAAGDCAKRNESAEALGIQTRYEVRELAPA